MRDEKKLAESFHVPWLEVVTLLSNLVVFKYYDFQEFLQKLIKIVVKVVPVDACLIYFYDKQKKELTLVASKKSHDELLGQITMRRGEGITGWVVEHNQTVAIEKEAYTDPRFKPFKELPEDKYESFLSVPIVNEDGVVGVINFQSRLPYSFLAVQIETLEAIVKIIASAFEKVVLERKIGALEDKLKERQIIEEAKGVIMKVKNLDESEAYHYLRREAMSKRKSMKEIAEAVLLVLK
jgi:uroporphyrinogen-III synthase